MGHFTHPEQPFQTNSCKLQQNCHYHYLFTISLTKSHDLIISSIYTQMQNSLQDALWKIGYNWPIGFGEKRYLEIVDVFSPYSY